MAGPHTLNETERAVQERLDSLPIDFEAMAAVSNLFRAANAVRNHLERTALAPSGMTWTGFVVLWVVWIWSPIETRDIASEAGISKATLTGVLNTLEGRGWLERQRSSEDGRLMVVTLTPAGSKLMKKLFPKFNDQEIATVSQVARGDLEKFTANLRSLTRSAEGS